MNYSFDIEYLPHQEKFINSTARLKMLITGYGGGKTLVCCMEALKMSAVNPGVPYMIVSPSYKMARKTIIYTMDDILGNRVIPGLVKGRDYTYNKSEFTYHIKLWNGIIIIGSAQDPDSLKGSNLCGCHLDEPGLMDGMAYKAMIARVRDPRSNLRSISLGGTPEGLNWLYDLWTDSENRLKEYEEQSAKLLKEIEDLDEAGDTEGLKKKKKKFSELKKPSIELIRGKTYDNIHLDNEYIQSLYNDYDEVMVNAYINGEFVNLVGMSAYHAYDNEKNRFGDSVSIDTGTNLLLGMDFNFNPMTSVLCQEKLVGDHKILYVFKEFYFKNCDTDSACEQIIDYINRVCGNDYVIDIYPDPSCRGRSAHGVGKSDLAIMKDVFDFSKTRYHLPAKKHWRKDRLNAVNRMLCNGNGDRSLFVHNDCKFLHKDLTYITKEQYLNANIDDPTLGHISDALGYLVAYRYPVLQKSGYIYERNLVI